MHTTGPSALNKIGHTLLDYAIPRNSAVASISTVVGAHTYRYSMTYGPGNYASIFNNWFTSAAPSSFESISYNLSHYVISPWFVPDISPEIAAKTGFVASLTTSILLNIISRLFFEGNSHMEPEIKQEPVLLLPEQTTTTATSFPNAKVLENDEKIAPKVSENLKTREMSKDTQKDSELIAKGRSTATLIKPLFDEDDPFHKGRCRWRLCC